MPLTRTDIPDLMLKGLRAEFDQAYRNELATGVAEQLATVINTTMPAQKYGWLGAAPAMREFVDERRPQGLNSNIATIEDKTFEATIAVERRAIEDDQLDLVRLRIKDLAQRVATHRHQLVIDALVKGGNTLGYDGINFFGIHNVNGTLYENKSNDLLEAGPLADRIGDMMNIADEAGIPLGIIPDTLVVGPSLMWQAMELVESPVVVYKGGASPPSPYKNVMNGRLNVVVSPFLRGSSSMFWFLMDTKRAIKGLVLQQRSDVPVEFTALESTSGSESAFMRDVYYYGVRGRYNVGYGLWQTCFAGYSGLA